MSAQNEIEQAEAIFVALQAQRAFKSDEQHDVPVMFAELMHYVHGTAEVDTQRVSGAISSNIPLRQQYQHLLTNRRVATMPMQAQAASDGLLTERSCRAFTIKFKTSKANPQQIYVILLAHAESGLKEGHAPVLLANKLAEVGRLCFPALTELKAQLLLDEADPQLVLMRDPDAELSLI